MTVFEVLRQVCARPGDLLLRKWNWKSAVFSSSIRAALFFFCNLKAGLQGAMGAMLLEFVSRGVTSGFYGALTQAFRKAEPVWKASLTVIVLLPLSSHSVEFFVHFMGHTPPSAHEHRQLGLFYRHFNAVQPVCHAAGRAVDRRRCGFGGQRFAADAQIDWRVHGRRAAGVVSRRAGIFRRSYLPDRFRRLNGLVPVTPILTNYKEQLLASLGQLPPFSPTLNRVLASLGREDVSFSYLGELIEKDTVLAGNILKLVNSALYNRRAEVSSIRYAVSLLGVNKLRNAVLSISVARMWTTMKSPPCWSTKQFNMHSVAVAVLGDLMAQRVPVTFEEGAFAAGLLHDLGRLLMATSLPDEYGNIMRRYDENGGTLCECERDVIGIDHAEVSTLALVSWNLPRPIRAAVRYHHAPDDDTTALTDGRAVRLSGLLAAANEYVNYLGVCVSPKNGASDAPSPERYFALMGDAAEAVSSAFEQEYDAVKAFF